MLENNSRLSPIRNLTCSQTNLKGNSGFFFLKIYLPETFIDSPKTPSPVLHLLLLFNLMPTCCLSFSPCSQTLSALIGHLSIVFLEAAEQRPTLAREVPGWASLFTTNVQRGIFLFFLVLNKISFPSQPSNIAATDDMKTYPEQKQTMMGGDETVHVRAHWPNKEFRQCCATLAA